MFGRVTRIMCEFSKESMQSRALMTLWLPSAAALCATPAACRLVGVSLLSLFTFPTSLLLLLLSLCFKFFRGASLRWAIFMIIMGSWSAYAVISAGRPDLLYFPAIYFLFAFSHGWQATLHQNNRPLLIECWCNVRQEGEI